MAVQLTAPIRALKRPAPGQRAAEQLEPRLLLHGVHAIADVEPAIDSSAGVAELAGAVPANYVHEYDRATGQQRIIDPSTYAAADDLDYLNGALRVQGYSGLDDLLSSLGSPEEFMRSLGGHESGNLGVSEAVDGKTGRTVFGTDSRTQITDATTFPWRAIGELATGCSGAMISPYHFLTAGHCVHSGGSGGSWYSNLDVSLGRTDTYNRPYGTADWTYVRSYTGWTQSADWSWDWALITLDRNIGNFTGWFGREWNGSTGYFNGTTVNTAGYPGDKPYGTMWFTNGPIGTSTSTHFYYNGTMDTAGGQSGSPVWRYDGTNRYIVGVHAYGDGGDGYNKAVRQTEGKFNDTGNWITSDNTTRPPTDRPDLTDYDAWFNTSFSYFSPDPVTHGQTLSLRTVVRNNGTAAAGAFTVSFYASTNNIISSGDYLLGSTSISSLGALGWADAITTAKVSSAIPAGNYYVGWIIDSGGTQTEYVESNNTSYVGGNLLTINAISPDAYEANNTVATAYSLGRLGTRNIASLNIHNSSDLDHFSFIADASGTLSASISFLNSNGDLDFQLLNSAGTVLTGSYTTGNGESFTYAVTKGQAYVLKIYGYSGSPNLSYSLNVNSPVAPPRITAATYAYEAGPWVYLDIDELLSDNVQPADVSIHNLTTGTTVNQANYTLNAYPSGALTYVDIHFTSVPADGNYELRVNAAGVKDLVGLALDGDNNGSAGGNYAFPFWHLGGDANRDRIVNVADLGVLASNWQQSPRTFSKGDFNYDGIVNVGDLGILATNWQKQLPATASPEQILPQARRLARGVPFAMRPIGRADGTADVSDLLELAGLS